MGHLEERRRARAPPPARQDTLRGQGKLPPRAQGATLEYLDSRA